MLSHEIFYADIIFWALALVKSKPDVVPVTGLYDFLLLLCWDPNDHLSVCGTTSLEVLYWPRRCKGQCLCELLPWWLKRRHRHLRRRKEVVLSICWKNWTKFSVNCNRSGQTFFLESQIWRFFLKHKPLDWNFCKAI